MTSRRSFVFRCAVFMSAIAAVWTVDARLGPARADAVIEARHTIEEASITVDRLREETQKSHELDNQLADAKGVLIIPSFYKAGFFIGGAYGDGVLLKRLPEGGFGDPAFYRMTAGSLGIQFGIDSSEVIFIIRTEKGLAAVLKDEFKMGANAGLAIASIGAGAEAATTTHAGADIVAYSKSAGLFMGAALEGAVIKPRRDWNAAVYGVDSDDPRMIIQRSGLKAATNLKDVLERNPSGVLPSEVAQPVPTTPTVNSSPVQPESGGGN